VKYIGGASSEDRAVALANPARQRRARWQESRRALAARMLPRAVGEWVRIFQAASLGEAKLYVTGIRDAVAGGCSTSKSRSTAKSSGKWPGLPSCALFDADQETCAHFFNRRPSSGGFLGGRGWRGAAYALDDNASDADQVFGLLLASRGTRAIFVTTSSPCLTAENRVALVRVRRGIR
jgi:hypothetical protein